MKAVQRSFLSLQPHANVREFNYRTLPIGRKQMKIESKHDTSLRSLTVSTKIVKKILAINVSIKFPPSSCGLLQRESFNRFILKIPLVHLKFSRWSCFTVFRDPLTCCLCNICYLPNCRVLLKNPDQLRSLHKLLALRYACIKFNWAGILMGCSKILQRIPKNLER